MKSPYQLVFLRMFVKYSEKKELCYFRNSTKTLQYWNSVIFLCSPHLKKHRCGTHPDWLLKNFLLYVWRFWHKKSKFKQPYEHGSHFAKHCRDQLQDGEWMDRLRNENFDFALTELFDFCSLGIFEKVGIKKFAAFTNPPMMHYMTESFGIPSMSSFIPGKLF